MSFAIAVAIATTFSGAIVVMIVNDDKEIRDCSSTCVLVAFDKAPFRQSESEQTARIAFGGRSGQHHVKDPLSACPPT
jgi:hypothetical protein